MDAAEARWRAAVEKALRGAPLATLTTHTLDGIAIDPLYALADDAPPGPSRDMTRPVRVVQRIDHPDLHAANRQAREDVAQGAGGLDLVFAGALMAHGFGVAVRDADDLTVLLDGIDPAKTALRLDLPADGAERIVSLVIDWVERQGCAPESVEIDCGLPEELLAGHSAAIGRDALFPDGEKVADRPDEGSLTTEHPPHPRYRGPSPRWGEGADGRPARRVQTVAQPEEGRAVPLHAKLCAAGIGSALLRADGRRHHAAGASAAQELAAVLSAAVAGLRRLEPLGLAQARDAIAMTLVAETDLVLTIAKLRAMRRLWARVEAACGLPPRPLRLHAETAWRGLARSDPHTNIVRQAIAAAGAILGGADSLAVLPFTAALGLPDADARRLARNTPLVLLEEARLGRIADLAAGAGAVEALTAALCANAWALFQDLEQAGGLAAALTDSAWPRAVAAMRERRLADLADGRATLVGVTAFRPSPTDPPPVLAPTPPTAPGRGDPLPARREAEPFEAAP